MHQKDDPLVIEFLALFHKVKELMDDNPRGLEKEAEKDPGFCRLCLKLAEAARKIGDAEKCGPSFASPVDRTFIRHWRDYEARYSRVIRHVDLFLGLFDEIDALPEANRPSLKDLQSQADFFARRYKKGFDSAINQAATIANDESSEIDEDYLFDMRQGLEEFDSLLNAGFDVQSAFRRKQLIPFVLVPRQVSNHYSPNGFISLFTHLQQVQTAFIFSADFAAIALARATLEMLLRNHYNSRNALDERSTLEDVINNAVPLPRSVRLDKLHDFRKLANKILHPVSVPPESQAIPEVEIVEILYLLRELIENAPSR